MYGLPQAASSNNSSNHVSRLSTEYHHPRFLET
eukprot:CCRYP_001811-RA/>CCRYP_001811-RA protein AED:0.48 eAED:0.48 QI:0/-1/0/1/-1/0/1/0/32